MAGRDKRTVTPPSISICRGLGTDTFHISDTPPTPPPPPSLLAKRTLSVCPPIGRGELRRSEVARTQRQQGFRGRGDGLTFQSPALRDLFIALCLLLSCLLWKADERKKTPPIQRWKREGKNGGYSIYLQPPGVCLWRSLVLSERSWGGAVFGWLDARWERCLSLFDVPGPFSLMPSLPSGLFALQRD